MKMNLVMKMKKILNLVQNAKTMQKCRFNSSEDDSDNDDSDDNDKRCRKIASKCRRDQTMRRYHSKKKSNEIWLKFY